MVFLAVSVTAVEMSAGNALVKRSIYPFKTLLPTAEVKLGEKRKLFFYYVSPLFSRSVARPALLAIARNFKDS